MSLETSIIKKKNFVYTVEMNGSLDSGTYQEFENELVEIIDDNTKAVVLDMTDLTYISSAGIRVVISTKKALKRKGASFAMINLQPQIRRVFEAMKILPIFNIFDDTEEADRYLDEIIKEELGKSEKE
ncbi:MAG: STAS domain-containing protein [Candidatus Omnitrophica bacterium]|nr:STAS domain-containing protein [Candidatus Omnitrophota bacterium]